RVAARETRIVTLTVTEKGYYHDPATGLLRPDDPDIQHDIRDPGRPRTAIGVLVRGLDRRRRAGTAPPTVISCDNLPDNGATLAGIVSAFASSIDDGLAAWIERHVAFPSTMVDRIVPATTPEDADRNATLLGVEDASPVLFEPFRQWVIEDRFGGPRPRWEAAGAQFVPDVRPFEHMKLRLLNGSHSAIAYLGYLAGHEYVHQAMADPPFRTFVERLMAREAGRTLEALPGVDLAAYQEALIARFANPALRHRTWQIAMDGSQKLPQRLLGTARDLIAADRPIDHVALAVAAWMRYAAGIDERGRRIEVSDPMADILRAVGSRAGDDPIALARGMLGLRAIFDPGLADDPRFSGPVVDAAKTLRAQGARGAVARLVDTVSM
ncbi:MAG TPA: mannitol dehydrogenase family protein, partial [Alphaproteobacteria bacterium]|nr:mannitol dehydrogenase family protein [Alphaproteobacteria bacterium]